MKHWFTRADAPIEQSFVKRFDPLHWTVDFPRGAMASVVAGEDARSLTVEAEFLHKGDLVGLIFESNDRHMHPAHRRELSLDYSNCQLSFEWQSSGITPLDAVNGPTLTIEGRDAAGEFRSWFARLWNYAEGSGQAAKVCLDFNELHGGFASGDEAERVHPGQIDRLFISLTAPGYVGGDETLFPTPQRGSVDLRNIECTGSGGTLSINDAMVPEHELRICTAYDDLYHLTPQRVIDAIERLGYRKVINHYVGMSHFFGLGADGRLDPARTFNEAALRWHRGFAREARARGYEVIWSLSYEILDMFCPETWKQRGWDGGPALTGYTPPSTLISPANEEAVAYLGRMGRRLVALSVEEGLEPRFQIGEPWWWIDQDFRPCIYDDAARFQFDSGSLRIDDVRGDKSPDEQALLDRAGESLAASTAEIGRIVRDEAPETELLLLTYLPGSLDPRAPHLRRANLPVGWARPAFDVLQLEDYEWVTSGRRRLSDEAIGEVSARLGYGANEQHYLSGFVATSSEREEWAEILHAARRARGRGAAEVFLWALPQVLRDGLTIFGEDEEVNPFDDVLFPIELGAEAAVIPGFSTTIVTSASGHEFRNVNWSQARLRFDAGPGVRGDAELELLINFFRARRGSATAFRFRDPYDHSSEGMSGSPGPGDQILGTADGVMTQFRLVKTYGSGEARRITRPVPGSVRVSVDGTEQSSGWEVGESGTISFFDSPAAGAVISAGFLFDVPVRFAADQLEISRASFRAGEAPSVPLVEVREDIE